MMEKAADAFDIVKRRDSIINFFLVLQQININPSFVYISTTPICDLYSERPLRQYEKKIDGIDRERKANK
jgi:hypothetical protein